ncbi:MAG: PspC domain-containing protein [Rhodothermales bacterium]|nr:PspC domain-containing protein [Rhodothermales bacterium]
MLIILLGFGVLSWRPNRKKKRVKKAIDKSTGKRAVIVDDVPGTKSVGKRKRLVKSRNKKIAGVCSGIAEYFNLDPTLVRIAFVIGTIATQGSIIPVYLVLAAVMPKAEAKKVEERITIIRDT